MNRNKNANEWLREIDDAQNLEHVTEVEKPIISRVRMFFSRMLTPTVNMGYYNEDTGQIVLGALSGSLADARKIITDTQVTNDVAAGTLTVPAGHAYKVKLVSVKSDRAPTITLDYTPSGGTAVQITDYPIALVASTTLNLLGGVTGYVAAAGSGASNGMISELWMQAGDTLTITIVNFVGGDATDLNFIFEDYEV